jgi:drug/metabolite transporter (DMT)-like permease
MTDQLTDQSTIDQRSVFGNKFGVVFFALLASLLWGWGYSGTKLGYEFLRINEHDTASKILFAGIRFMIAGTLVLLVSLVMYRKPPLLKAGEYKGILLLSFFQTILQYGALYVALAYISGAKSSILNQTGSFLLILFSHFLYKNDAFTFPKALGCVAGFLGIILINLGAGMNAGFSLAGEGLIVVSSVSGAAGYVVSKRISRAGNPLIITGYQQLSGGIVLSAIGFFSGGKIWLAGLRAAGILIYLSISIAAAYSLWVELLKYNDVSRVSVFKFAVPVFGVVFSGLLLGENLFKLKNWISLLLVCFGIVVINIRKAGYEGTK